jgi:hypothetical protein
MKFPQNFDITPKRAADHHPDDQARANRRHPDVAS